jgi:hypothetical protein
MLPSHEFNMAGGRIVWEKGGGTVDNPLQSNTVLALDGVTVLTW